MDALQNAYGSPFPTAYNAGFAQGLAAAAGRMSFPGYGPSAMMPGNDPMGQMGQMGQMMQSQQLMTMTIATMMMLLMKLMANQGQSAPNGAATPDSGSAGASASPDAGGGAAASSGGGDVSTPSADPNAQIPSSGPNPGKQEVGQMLEAAAKKYGIPTDILKAIAWKESGWNASAKGDGGASYGIMQIYTKAHPDYNAQKGVQDPSYNIDYGAKLLRSLYDRYHDWGLAVQHYNGSGPMAQRYQADVFNNLLPKKPWPH